MVDHLRLFHRDEEEPSHFERRVAEELREALPDDWHLTPRSPAAEQFDVVATSPDGNIFPIEVSGGDGRLDVSTVVEFGAAVRRHVAGLAGSAELEVPRSGDVHEVGIKPIYVTPKVVPPASSEYADTFHIEIIEAPSSSTPQGKRDTEHGLATRLAKSLKEWDEEIHRSQYAVPKQAVPQTEKWFRGHSK